MQNSKNLNFSPAGSSFKCELVFDPLLNQGREATNIYYSKREDQPEATDKPNVLRNMVCRIVDKHRDKFAYMVAYEKRDKSLATFQKNEIKLFVVYPCGIGPVNNTTENLLPLDGFLKSLNERLETNHPDILDLKRALSKSKIAGLLDSYLFQKKFKTQEDLSRFVKTWSLEGRDPALLQQFKTDYINRYFL